MEALNDLVQAGKVRALGASAMYGYQFYNLQLCARDHGWARFEAMETTITSCTARTSGNSFPYVVRWGYRSCRTARLPRAI